MQTKTQEPPFADMQGCEGFVFIPYEALSAGSTTPASLPSPATQRFTAVWLLSSSGGGASADSRITRQNSSCGFLPFASPSAPPWIVLCRRNGYALK